MINQLYYTFLTRLVWRRAGGCWKRIRRSAVSTLCLAAGGGDEGDARDARDPVNKFRTPSRLEMTVKPL